MPIARRHPRSRPGTAYLAAVGVGMLVAVLSIGSMASARSRSRALQLRVDEEIARQNAVAAVDYARAVIASDSSWRTTYMPEMWLYGVEFNAGTIGYSVVNPSGALNRDPLDSVVVTGDGVKGLAHQRMSVTLDASKVPLTCLSVPMTIAGAVSATSATINGSGLTIATNAGFTSALATIQPNVEARTTITGTGFSGTTSTGVTARTLPDTTVFSLYTAAAATIPVSSLPTVTVMTVTRRRLKDIVLGPNHNPYGSTNPSGLYVLDCQNQILEISQCRIIGTLVLLNLGIGSYVGGSVQWTPAVSNYPCLLVNGNISLSLSSSSLSEATEIVNFNPPGAPYPFSSGAADTDQSDSYPSVIDGMIYASGSVLISGSNTVDMLVAGDTCTLTAMSSLTLLDEPAYAAAPPPGFYTVKMSPRLGSWAYIVDP
jgi:hypothetical protein